MSMKCEFCKRVVSQVEADEADASLPPNTGLGTVCPACADTLVLSADLVRQEDACPGCGERDSDELVWLDDERVECQRCHTIYRPGQAPVQKP